MRVLSFGKKRVDLSKGEMKPGTKENAGAKKKNGAQPRKKNLKKKKKKNIKESYTEGLRRGTTVARYRNLENDPNQEGN